MKRARQSSELAIQSEGPHQVAIDAILEGPPFNLSEIAEDQLPYWLQAVRWFAGVVPERPTAGEIAWRLEKLRIRSRLRIVAGDDFRGRVDEVKQLNDWFDEDSLGPIMMSGIGGIGKSALIAKFALQLPAETCLFWLDFDRADLAPDDAVSVLIALSQQASVQLEPFGSPDINGAPTRTRGSTLLDNSASSLCDSAIGRRFWCSTALRSRNTSKNIKRFGRFSRLSLRRRRRSELLSVAVPQLSGVKYRFKSHSHPPPSLRLRLSWTESEV